MRQVSLKMAAQKKKEKALTLTLLERCHGLCESCGRLPDWRGLSKHEKVFRSQGGDPLDPDNVEILCARCHSRKHGLVER